MWNTPRLANRSYLVHGFRQLPAPTIENLGKIGFFSDFRPGTAESRTVMDLPEEGSPTSLMPSASANTKCLRGTVKGHVGFLTWVILQLLGQGNKRKPDGASQSTTEAGFMPQPFHLNDRHILVDRR